MIVNVWVLVLRTRSPFLVAVLCVACGRVNFDPIARDDAPVQPDVAVLPDALVDLVGCSDGEREGFVDRTSFPDIAGCSASWAGTPSLRAAPTDSPCGDDGGPCSAPSDACAAGWHVCLASGDPADLSIRITGGDCAAAGTGAFVAAASHCVSIAPCDYTPPLPCLAVAVCAEPVCCGSGCNTGTVCRAGVFAAPQTMIADDRPNGCAALPSGIATGVLCCAD